MDYDTETCHCLFESGYSDDLCEYCFGLYEAKKEMLESEEDD